MSATFLAVLKIAGIVLLVLLLVFLVVCVVVLLWPVSFYLEADIPETPLTDGAAEKIREQARINAGFTWLLRLIHTGFSYPFEENFSVRVLWWRWQKKQAEDPAEQDLFEQEAFADMPVEPKPLKEETTKEETIKEEKIEEKKAEPQVTAEEAAGGQDTPGTKASARETRIPERTTTAKTERTAAGAEPQESRRGPTLFDFFSAIFRVASFVLTKPYEVLWKIQYTISSVCDKIDEVRAFWDSALFHRAKDVVLLRSGQLLKGIRPKRANVQLLFGTGDPALTADLLAAYSMLYPLFGAYSTVDADFDRSVLGLHARISGRVTFFRLLNTLGVMYFNKDIRKAIRRAQRILQR